jgi:hypothetical protein
MSWYNAFLLAGTWYFIVGVIKFLWYVVDTFRMWRDLKSHEQYCEECADELMAETFKSMRERDDKR